MDKPLFMWMPDINQSWSDWNGTIPKMVPETLPNLANVMRRHVGVEIEVEKCGNMNFRDFPGIAGAWNIEKDASLRGQDAYEFKTVFPSNCAEVLEALKGFYDMVDAIRKAERGVFDFSERTSIHIHVDVRDLTSKQIKALVKLYMIYEKSFFDFIGRHRYHNVFCIPVAESTLLNKPRGKTFYSEWDKYCALNLATLQQFGTVEFRGMAGTDDVKTIIAWVLMVTCLVEQAASIPPEEVDSIINDLKVESQYQQLIRDLLGDDYAELLTMFPEASDQAASLTKLL